jgi:hypothetical protein
MRLIILVLAFLAGLCASSFAQTTSRDYEIMLTTASTAAAKRQDRNEPLAGLH